MVLFILLNASGAFSGAGADSSFFADLTGADSSFFEDLRTDLRTRLVEHPEGIVLHGDEATVLYELQNRVHLIADAVNAGPATVSGGTARRRPGQGTAPYPEWGDQVPYTDCGGEKEYGGAGVSVAACQAMCVANDNCGGISHNAPLAQNACYLCLCPADGNCASRPHPNGWPYFFQTLFDFPHWSVKETSSTCGGTTIFIGHGVSVASCQAQCIADETCGGISHNFPHSQNACYNCVCPRDGTCASQHHSGTHWFQAVTEFEASMLWGGNTGFGPGYHVQQQNAWIDDYIWQWMFNEWMHLGTGPVTATCWGWLGDNSCQMIPFLGVGGTWGNPTALWGTRRLSDAMDRHETVQLQTRLDALEADTGVAE